MQQCSSKMEFLTSFITCFFLSSALLTNADKKVNSPPCHFPTVFNFGDSNSDTGGIAAAFYPPVLPMGATFFHKPAGRASDGRLIIDFITDHLGLPYLSPYLDSLGSSYQHGADFATGGATIMRPSDSWFASGVSPFNLEIQVEHFTQLKDRTADFYNKSKDECLLKRIPKPSDIYLGLFTIDIGQNDIAAVLRSSTYEKQLSAIPAIISQFVSQIRILYQRGAKTFWIHNTGPIGCLAISIARVKDPAPGYLDAVGCVKSQNDIAVELNKQMKAEVVKLRAELSDAALVYVDMYKAKYDLIANAKTEGFIDPFRVCCGYHGIGYDVYCGNKGTVNGTEVFAGSCQDPSRVISWDGIHYTEAANQWIANRIVNGSLSDPPVAISQACYNQRSSNY